jgi:hypothetical protein
VRFFNDQLLAIGGIYTEYKKNIWGCDSITVLNLTFVSQPDDVHIYDTICADGIYLFEGDTISESGTYTKMLPSYYGCDSIRILHLVMEVPIGATVEDGYHFVCADDEVLLVPYEPIEGRRLPKAYSVLFDNFENSCGFVNQNDIAIVEQDENFVITIPTGCRPNSYKATILLKDVSSICGDLSIPVEFDVYYSSSILEAKFNNIITIYDADYNGGYSFVSYQWYKNGEVMEGDTMSYFKLPEGEVFARNDCYHLVLERKDDGVIMPTCAICPGLGTDIENNFVDDLQLITLVDPTSPIVIDNVSDGFAFIYTITGQLLTTYNIKEHNSVVTVPSISGFYLMRIVTGNMDRVYKIKVK